MTSVPPRRRATLLSVSVLLGVGLAAGGQLLADPRPAPVATSYATGSGSLAISTTGDPRSAQPTFTPAQPRTSAPATSTSAPATSPTSSRADTRTSTTHTSTRSSPATPTAGPSGTRPADPHAAAIRRVVELVNARRAEAGCPPLTLDPRLTRAAQRHSEDMSARGYFAHTTPEGVTFAERIRRAGYPAPAAENIARGPHSAERVMRLWMNSPGHRANILNCAFTAIGVGLDRDGWYWTQTFGY